MAYSIDTAAAMRRLEEVGFESDKARVIVETVAESDEGLATKGDMAALKSDRRSLPRGAACQQTSHYPIRRRCATRCLKWSWGCMGKL